MSNQVPTKARLTVIQREQGRCLRCGGPGVEWAHRRTRADRQPHQHCPCNGAWLCRTCHAWCHSNPAGAMALGFMVSRYVAEPSTIPVHTWYGVLYLLCDGDIRFKIGGDDARDTE